MAETSQENEQPASMVEAAPAQGPRRRGRRAAAQPQQPQAVEEKEDGGGGVADTLNSALKVLGSIAGAAAVFSALATFVGWQYLKAYYRELGIPFSELSFSTRDYLFATQPTATLAFYALALTAIGATVGWLWPTKARTLSEFGKQVNSYALEQGKKVLPTWLTEKGETSSFANAVVVAWAYFNLTANIIARAALLLLLVLAGLVALEGAAIGLAIFGTGLFGMGSAYLVVSFVQQKTRPHYLAVGFLVLGLVLSLGLIIGPEWIGEKKAERLIENPKEFTLGTFITKGASGIPGEYMWPPAPPRPVPCQEFVEWGQGQPTPSLCKGVAVLVVHNNGSYFVRNPCAFASPERKVYQVDEDRVVRVSYESEWRTFPTTTPCVTSTRTPTETPTGTPTVPLTATPTPPESATAGATQTGAATTATEGR